MAFLLRPRLVIHLLAGGRPCGKGVLQMNFEIRDKKVVRVGYKGDIDEIHIGLYGYEIWPLPNMRVIMDKPDQIRELNKLFAELAEKNEGV